MVLGYIKRGRLRLDEVIKALHTANTSLEDVFAYLFTHSWNVMTLDAQHLLLAFAFFVDPASKEAIGAVSGLANERLNRALEQLVELALLDINEEWQTSHQRYSIHPLTRAFANAQLEKMKDIEEQSRLRWCNYYLNFAAQSLLREKPKERYWNTLASVECLQLIDPEWGNLQHVLGWLNQQGQDQYQVELILLLVHYMDKRLLNSQRIHYVQQAAEAAKRLKWKEDEALLRIDGLGWTLIEACRYDEAEREITHGLHIAESMGSEVLRALGLIALAHTFLARVFLEREEAEKASAYISRVNFLFCEPVIQVVSLNGVGTLESVLDPLHIWQALAKAPTLERKTTSSSRERRRQWMIQAFVRSIIPLLGSTGKPLGKIWSLSITTPSLAHTPRRPVHG